MNLNRKLFICAAVVSTAITLTGDHEASGRDKGARPAVTRRAAAEFTKQKVEEHEPDAPTATDTAGAMSPSSDQVMELKDHALNVLKQTKVAVKFQILPQGLLGKDPKLALKTAISVENPPFFRWKNEVTIEASARGEKSLDVESAVSLPRDSQPDLRPLLLEEPVFVVCGADRPGPAVWYVNGVLTSKTNATAAGEQISARLDRRVHVLHNPTVIEPPFQSGLQVAGFRTGDLSESTYDRAWPAVVVGRLLAESLLGKRAACPEKLQGNPTTRRLAWVLYHSDQPVSLVTHSQGCLIARNAFFTMALLGNESKVRNNVAWVAAGIPISDYEICPRPNRTTILDYRDDPVPKIVGLRGGGIPFNPADHDFMGNYVEQLNEDLVFPADTLTDGDSPK